MKDRRGLILMHSQRRNTTPPGHNNETLRRQLVHVGPCDSWMARYCVRVIKQGLTMRRYDTIGRTLALILTWLLATLCVDAWANENQPPEISSENASEDNSTSDENTPPGSALIAGEPISFEGLGLKATVGATLRAGIHSDFPVDSDGTRLDGTLILNSRIRIGATYEKLLPFALLTLAYEHDFLSGPIHGSRSEVEGMFMPGSEDVVVQALRKAYAQLSFGRYLHVKAGVTTSHWGLGMTANDGAHGWKPGNARFADPRGGDRVLRAQLATGPHGSEEFFFFTAADLLLGDDVLLEGDEGYQVVGGMKMGSEEGYQVGLYGAYRVQHSTTGDTTEVGIVDLFGAYSMSLCDRLRWEIAMEGAVVFGSTSLAPSAQFPTHDVLQIGAVLRTQLDAGMGGGVLDLIYASGDEDFDDKVQNGFRMDRNLETGLLLYRHVLAAMSARTTFTASDPDLVGVPSEDLERLPTRGAATNTIAIFPRAWVRPVDGLEIYGGPLVAFTEVSLADALNSRLAGGEVHNALNGKPGAYLGTELDLGVRFTTLLWGTELQLAVEAGILFPGDALVDAGGEHMNMVWGGRAMASYRF